MKIELNSEDELDAYIICHKCHTLNREVLIENGSKALCCSQCGIVLYHHDNGFLDRGLALSISGLIFFIIANVFPLVQINILGSESFISILSMIDSLMRSGYYLTGLFITYLIFIFPLMIFLLYFFIFYLMKRGTREILVGNLLILLARIIPWHMSDIFLISILVAIVKLLGIADIHLGVSFWALIIFVLIDIYFTRNIHLRELWMLRKQVYQLSEEEAPHVLG